MPGKSRVTDACSNYRPAPVHPKDNLDSAYVLIPDLRAQLVVSCCRTPISKAPCRSSQWNLKLTAFLVEEAYSVFTALFPARESLELTTGHRAKGWVIRNSWVLFDERV
jgi:hypothetical protein